MWFRFLLGFLIFLGLPSFALQNKILRGPYLQNPKQNSILIKYRTKNPTPTLVKYWKQNSPDRLLRYQDMVSTTDHHVLLTNLDTNSFYEYEIESQTKNIFENISNSSLEYQFKTLGSSSEALLWVIGDPGVAGYKEFRKKYKKNQQNILLNFLAYQKAKNLRDPDAILSLGDNTYFYGFDEEYQKGFFDQYDFLLSKLPVYTVFGNHDAGIDKNYLTYNSRSYPKPHGVYFDIFDSPNKQAYYSFNLGSAHFIVLDSFDSLWEQLKSDRSNYEKVWSQNSIVPNPMLDWLKEDLANNKSRWTVVAFHHPPYGTDDEGSQQNNLFRAWMNSNVVPIIEKYQVDLVLCGHIHNYQRSYPVKSSEEVLDISLNKQEALDFAQNPYKNKLSKLFSQSNLSSFKATPQQSKINKYLKNSGTIYAIIGSSGAAFNSIEVNPNQMFAVQKQIEGSALLAITESKLSLKFITINGEIGDEFLIESL
jgi:3',5'-cyclic AMP phosphodiesterase CpdA